MGRLHDVIVVHYHEIGLKGRNRGFFERRLLHNLHTAIGGPKSGVRSISGRVLVDLPRDHPEETLRQVGRVFGVSNYSEAITIHEPTMETLVERAVEYARGSEFESFEVRARKGHSSFTEGTQKVNEVVGQAIKDATGAAVDLTDPQWSCHIELVHDAAYLYSRRHRGPGGLPVGVSGGVLALMSGGIDSPVAAWEVAKRGATTELIHFHGQPYSDPSSVWQANRLAEHLAPSLVGTKLWLIPFGDIQKEIVTASPQELRVVLYRRFMMRIAERLAQRESLQALVTGESLGQVASQTLPNISAVDAAVERLPVLRPLIGRDKIEIEERARAIGTYEVSIQPHQDCCVLFVPRQPTTAASIEELEEAEVKLDVSALVDKGVANAEVVAFG
jgi:thiamine biosynthesis protein ThiI